MATVWKYEIPIQEHFALDMPPGAKPLTVQLQHDVPHLWALVEPVPDRESHLFRLVGTGQDEAEGRYVGTFQLYQGSLVLHVFDLGELSDSIS